MEIHVAELASPIGMLALAAGPRGLVALEFDVGVDALAASIERRLGAAVRPGPMEAVASRLRAYFDGEIGALDALEVAPSGTPFQVRVWRELRNVAAGRTISYRDLAVAVGQPTATRAVGLANGRNPIALAIPCHRVIGSDGGLTGYGGGLHRKRWLLEHEGALLPLG